MVRMADRGGGRGFLESRLQLALQKSAVSCDRYQSSGQGGLCWDATCGTPERMIRTQGVSEDATQQALSRIGDHSNGWCTHHRLCAWHRQQAQGRSAEVPM